MELIKKKYKFLIIFLIIFVFYFIYMGRFYDSLTQYGMARAIINGEIPYNDFNTVTTPLFIFVHAIFLIIYDSHITYTIINSLIFTLTCYYIDKIVPNHFWTLFLLVLFPFLDVICPSYNLLAKLILVLIIYLEKEKRSDFLIGVFLGLLILSKHSIGLCVLLCSFLYVKKISRIKDRLLGVIIPCSIFLLYLLFTNSLYSFIDLTILGLFDFGNKNIVKSPFFIVIFILLLIYYIYLILKNKKEDNYLLYYAIGSLSFMIPIFDINHFTGAYICFLILLFTKYEIKLNYFVINTSFIIMFMVSTFIFFKETYRPYKILSYNHFPIFFRDFNDNIDEVLEYYGKKYPNSKMFSSRVAFYDIVLDKKYTYFDVPLTGNFGHLGSKKIISLLEDNKYYFINKNCDKQGIGQYDVVSCEYIRDNSKFIETIDNYDIYYYNNNVDYKE